MNRALPMYAQLKEDIISAIVEGSLSFGDQLPSQRTLCEEYGMSHMTVRRALNELIHEGVIYGIPGKGTYVAQQKQDAESGPLVSFTEDMVSRGMLASSRVLAARIISASTVLAKALGIEVGAPLAYLHRLRLADGAPMAVQTAYLPHALCPGLLEYDLEQGSLYAVLRQVYGLNLRDSVTTVEAELADEEQAALLGLTLPTAVLVSEQLSYLDTGQAIESVRSVYRGDRYRLRLR